MTMHTTMDGRKSGQLRQVLGDWMDDSGFMARRGRMPVIVTDDGIAYPYLPVDTIYNAEDFGPITPLKAERWPDGDYLGRNFCLDEGEFERCGIAYVTCGSPA
jgi:hypothetical protein